MTMQQDHACFWCGRGFVPRRDGGKPQVFCRPVCRRDFDTARRRCVAQAIASGVLTVGALRDASAATRALRRWGEGLSPLPDIGSPDNAFSEPMTRFLVEVPRSTIEAFVRLSFIGSHQQYDLPAIMGALRCLGQMPSISRIA
jgi:hypothetical protein